MDTVWTIPTQTEYWGADYSPEDALAVARKLRDALAERYPEVEFRLVPERQSWNNRAQGSEDLLEDIRLVEEELWQTLEL